MDHRTCILSPPWMGLVPGTTEGSFQLSRTDARDLQFFVLLPSPIAEMGRPTSLVLPEIVRPRPASVESNLASRD